MRYLGQTVAILLLCLSMAAPARAVTLLRDADIEHALKQLARPILTAAGLPVSSIRVLVVKESDYNAFVVDSRHIFITSGLLMKLTSAAQLQSVLAHEAAHISNGHLSRRVQNARAASSIAGLGLALAAAAAAAGSDQAAVGLGLGVSSSAQRVFFAHTRAEESAADASGLRYMIRAGVNPMAFLEVLEIFRGQEYLAEHRQDPYARTHPLSRDRLRAIQARAASVTPPRPDTQDGYWFARAKGKLAAWERAPKWTLRRAPQSLTPDIRLLREASAYHRIPDAKRAIAAADRLIALRPKDAFAHDLRGQILLENRRVQAAVGAYRTASALAPKDALIMAGYGRALLAAKDYGSARKVLEKARRLDGRDARMLRDLAQTYAALKQPGLASVVTAERYALIGRPKDALLHAKRAGGLLPRGSASWLRAQDVISVSEAAVNKRN
ncbi:M48 family metalloprotease [Thalassobius sp. S69A]|uniref:M48 family metalloprotease n=1 Tax=unclassified Thalassovita TaxID=2619711 RepID=UPI003C7EA339